MSKKFRVDYYEDDDANYRSDYYEDLRERRKMKRIRNAIRSKNIDDLMRNYDEDYDGY